MTNDDAVLTCLLDFGMTSTCHLRRKSHRIDRESICRLCSRILLTQIKKKDPKAERLKQEEIYAAFVRFFRTELIDNPRGAYFRPASIQTPGDLRDFLCECKWKSHHTDTGEEGIHESSLFIQSSILVICLTAPQRIHRDEAL